MSLHQNMWNFLDEWLADYQKRLVEKGCGFPINDDSEQSILYLETVWHAKDCFECWYDEKLIQAKAMARPLANYLVN